ncbi:BPTI/Kunitz domain-containing protein 2-like isoform X1 [Sphaerodactylus townsendi]|uniref:BPTI/Kunitz domain-containing protein 2-like isoform X1 n=1 Tax=Sphaerodactylus townsendi TaxID=933632 RepID=UPI00202715C9|nr:BPTI/Kunitz domain-containing protein 2-like isoform X1 [Sphaerodactylus townsendi]
MKLGSGTGVGAFRGLLPGVAGGGALKKVRGGASAGGAQGDGGGGGCRGRVEASGWGLGGGGQPRMDGGPATATDPRVRQDGPVGGAKRPGAPAREAPADFEPWNIWKQKRGILTPRLQPKKASATLKASASGVTQNSSFAGLRETNFGTCGEPAWRRVKSSSFSSREKYNQLQQRKTLV